MADSDHGQQTPTMQHSEKELKYLDFVQVAAIYVIVCLTSLYEFAKDNAGPLKAGVQSVESAVKTVTGPVYGMFHGVPLELLRFVDRKVDESLSDLDSRVPPLVKQASFQARAVATQVQQTSLADTAKNIAKNVYTKYEPAAEKFAVSAWHKLNQLPLFPQIAQITVPTAAYWSEKYNQAVTYSGKRGYPLASYLPSIPTRKIAKMFQERENTSAIVNSGEEAVIAE